MSGIFGLSTDACVPTLARRGGHAPNRGCTMWCIVSRPTAEKIWRRKQLGEIESPFNAPFPLFFAGDSITIAVQFRTVPGVTLIQWGSSCLLGLLARAVVNAFLRIRVPKVAR